MPAVPLLLFCVTLCERACPSLRSSPGVCLACAHGFGVRRLLFLVGAVAAVMWVGGAPRSGALGWAGRGKEGGAGETSGESLGLSRGRVPRWFPRSGRRLDCFWLGPGGRCWREGCGLDGQGAQWPHGVSRACAGSVRLVCGVVRVFAGHRGEDECPEERIVIALLRVSKVAALRSTASG